MTGGYGCGPVDVAQRASAAPHPLSTTPPQPKSPVAGHATNRPPAHAMASTGLAALPSQLASPGRLRRRAALSSASRSNLLLHCATKGTPAIFASRPESRLRVVRCLPIPSNRVRVCFCSWIAMQAGGDLQRAGGGADQHCAGDARPADEHTGGGRHGDAGAAGGQEGAGRGLRRQVPRQAAPGAGRFPPGLGRHCRQCTVTSGCHCYRTIQSVQLYLLLLLVVILCALHWS